MNDSIGNIREERVHTDDWSMFHLRQPAGLEMRCCPRRPHRISWMSDALHRDRLAKHYPTLGIQNAQVRVEGWKYQECSSQGHNSGHEANAECHLESRWSLCPMNEGLIDAMNRILFGWSADEEIEQAQWEDHGALCPSEPRTDGWHRSGIANPVSKALGAHAKVAQNEVHSGYLAGNPCR